MPDELPINITLSIRRDCTGFVTTVVDGNDLVAGAAIHRTVHLSMRTALERFAEDMRRPLLEVLQAVTGIHVPPLDDQPDERTSWQAQGVLDTLTVTEAATADVQATADVVFHQIENADG